MWHDGGFADGLRFFKRTPFASGDGRENVFDIFPGCRRSDKKDGFNALELIETEPVVAFGQDVLLPGFDRVREWRGGGRKDPLCPGRPIHGDHVHVAILVGSEHDTELIAGLRVSAPVHKYVAVFDRKIRLNAIDQVFFDEQHVQTDGLRSRLNRLSLARYQIFQGLSGLIWISRWRRQSCMVIRVVRGLRRRVGRV